MTYTLCGNRDYIRVELEKIKRDFDLSNVSSYDMNSSSFDEVIRDLNTFGLFGKKLVIVYNFEVFSDDDSLEYIYERIRNKSVCIDGLSVINDDNLPMSLMFYTIRTFSCGSLFHVFMHECGHIIDLNSERTGFESFNDYTYNSINNPYDECFRKYEKFNEALNDIFTIEAVELLHNQGIYLIEPQEFTLLDTSEINTASLTKNLLQPLLAKFRKQVISAKIKADRSELIRYIGNDNFEELVDVVNKVDYLSRNGLTSKLDTSPEDEMVKEYFEQVERAKRIYRNIDDYYSDNVDDLMTYPKK